MLTSRIKMSINPRSSFYITSPEFSTRGESAGAYLQRLLAILLVASCGVISVTNWYDCRFLKYDPSETSSEELIVGSTVIAEFLDRFGSNSSSWYSRNATEEDYEFGCNYTAIWIGLHQSAAICVVDDESDNKQEYYECQPEYYGVIFPTLSKPRQRMFKAAKLVGLLTPIFSLFGIICAFVEFCFCAFYPSVIIGAIFFSGAALSEITMLAVWYYDTIACIARDECHLGIHFYLSCFSAGGLFTSSCLLIFGPRTYPWMLRKNRLPGNCRIVDAEVVQEIHGTDDDVDVTSASFSIPSVSLDVYNKLHDELEETKQALLEAEEKLAVATDRAERAEALTMSHKTDKEEDEK